MLVKGYSFSEIYKNNTHNFKEQAVSYDGDVLSVIHNNDGVVTVNQFTNDELLKHIGTFDKPLIKRLEDNFTISKKRNTKSKSKTRSKSKHTLSNKTTNSRSKSKNTKTTSKSHFKTQKSKRQSERKTKSHSKRGKLTPDIMKTIF